MQDEREPVAGRDCRDPAIAGRTLGGCSLADIQLEHGFTRIADALLEAICGAPVPGRHLRVFVTVIRMTYGFGKRSDRIAASQISKLTGIDRRSVTLVLGELEAAGMIWRGPLRRGRSRRIGIVKDFERWTHPAPSGSADDPTLRAPSGSAHDPTPHARVDSPTVAGDPGGGSPTTPQVGAPTTHTRERERLTRESAAATPRESGTASPRTSRTATSKNPETIGAASPRRSGTSNFKTAVRKTRCPARLDSEDRARLVAWRDEEHPTKFSNLELAAQWIHFHRWHTGQLSLDADWAGRFQNWLTSDKYHPLTNGQAARADSQVVTANQEPRPAWDADEWERVAEECRKIREATGLNRAPAPAQLRTSRDRAVAL